MVEIDRYKRIHCLGIGGIGLSAVAEILNDNGHIVSGSDIKYSDVTSHLESIGIKVYYEHQAQNVDGVDAIVYSAAVSDENPEVIRARELNIPLFSRAEVLGMLMENYENSIAICGTHGKTTVTSMTSLVLRNAKYKPTILVGGNLPEINGNVEIGDNKYFVTEACEYMDSFLNLKPSIGVILNIDSDHLDYFKDMDHIVRSFKSFVEKVGDDGVIVAYGDNPFVKEILKNRENKITYGYSESCDYYADYIMFDDRGFPEYDLLHKGEAVARIKLAVPGEHNVLNSMASFVTAKYLGVDTDVIVSTLADFGGTHRRFDYTGITENKVRVIDDYAHHPTEVRATLSAAKNIKHNKLWVIFQPHTYTRTKALFDDFIDCFEDTDALILTEIYAARERDIYNISTKKLYDAMKEAHPEREIYHISEFDEIAAFIRKNACEDDIVITMGAGDVNKIGEILVDSKEG